MITDNWKAPNRPGVTIGTVGGEFALTPIGIPSDSCYSIL